MYKRQVSINRCINHRTNHYINRCISQLNVATIAPSIVSTIASTMASTMASTSSNYHPTIYRNIILRYIEISHFDVSKYRNPMYIEISHYDISKYHAWIHRNIGIRCIENHNFDISNDWNPTVRIIILWYIQLPYQTSIITHTSEARCELVRPPFGPSDSKSPGGGGSVSSASAYSWQLQTAISSISYLITCRTVQIQSGKPVLL